MWLMKDNPCTFIDLYELTMAQAYFLNKMPGRAFFEVSIRRLPENWGFFVMAGLQELEDYLKEFKFREDDVEFLRGTGFFKEGFLEFLKKFKIDIKIRAIPEGTVFFADEPIVEVEGDLISAQILETYVLNILGFSIITASLAARTTLAAKGIDLMEFGLRRSQSPVAGIRAARAAQIAGFKSTSNLFAAKTLNFPCAGTMAHSFVEVFESEEKAFENFAELYGGTAVFLIDTYEPTQGIIRAAEVAARFYKEKGIKVRGIRIDSGHLEKLSKFARNYFEEQGVPFTKIFVSGDLDEYRIEDLINNGAEIDGIGIGTRFIVSKYVPSVDIVYKIVQYEGKNLFKTSPDKQTRPGRKSIQRIAYSGQRSAYRQDVVSEYKSRDDDLLKPFEKADDMPAIQKRLREELSRLEPDIKKIRNPAQYPVIFK